MFKSQPALARDDGSAQVSVQSHPDTSPEACVRPWQAVDPHRARHSTDKPRSPLLLGGFEPAALLWDPAVASEATPCLELASRHFRMFGAAASRARDLAWVACHRDALRLDVAVEDVSDSLCVIGVMGPRSRALLASLARAAYGVEALAHGASLCLRMCGIAVRVTRLCYAGELGCELAEGARDAATRASEQVAALLESYVDPGLDAAVDAALQAYVAERKASMPDRAYI